MLLAWTAISLSLPLEQLRASHKQCGTACSMAEHACSCGEKAMMKDCPAMKADAHPVLLLLPVAPLSEDHSFWSTLNTLNAPLPVNSGNIVAEPASHPLFTGHDPGPPPLIHNKHYILLDTFLI